MKKWNYLMIFAIICSSHSRTSEEEARLERRDYISTYQQKSLRHFSEEELQSLRMYAVGDFDLDEDKGLDSLSRYIASRVEHSDKSFDYSKENIMLSNLDYIRTQTEMPSLLTFFKEIKTDKDVFIINLFKMSYMVNLLNSLFQQILQVTKIDFQSVSFNGLMLSKQSPDDEPLDITLVGTNQLIQTFSEFLTPFNEEEQQEWLTSSSRISTLLLQVRLETLIMNYQKNKDNTILYMLPFSDDIISQLFNLRYENTSSSNNTIFLKLCSLYQALTEILDALFMDLMKNSYKTYLQGYAKNKSKTIFDTLYVQEFTKCYYYYICHALYNHDKNDTQFRNLLININQKNLSSFYEKNDSNFIYLDTETRTLKLNFPPKLYEDYCNTYMQATENGKKVLKLEFKDFWGGTITLPVTPLEECKKAIERKIQEKKESLVTKVTKVIVETVKDAEEDVDAIMKALGLDSDNSTSGKKKKKAKQPAAAAQQQKPDKKKEQSKPKQTAAEKMDAEPQAAAEKSTEQDDQSHSIYTYNKKYASIGFDLFPRIKQWRLTTLENPVALSKQGYFTAGSDRSDILQRITTEYGGDQNQAIQNIIFTHQLPTELVQATLRWGTIDDKTDPKVIQATAVVHVKSDIVNGYYLAEIAGKIKSENFISIFHSFLRPINNIQLFMSNILTDTQNEENRLAARESDRPEDSANEKTDDEGEWQSESGWIVTDTGPAIVISKDNTTFTLFKQ